MVEATVFLHELGHLFGLVNNGVPMVRPHEDVDHPGHDPDEGCLMYWALETEDAVGLIADRFLWGERRPAARDAACLDDLGAAMDTGRESAATVSGARAR